MICGAEADSQNVLMITLKFRRISEFRSKFSSYKWRILKASDGIFRREFDDD